VRAKLEERGLEEWVQGGGKQIDKANAQWLKWLQKLHKY